MVFWLKSATDTQADPIQPQTSNNLIKIVIFNRDDIFVVTWLKLKKQ